MSPLPSTAWQRGDRRDTQAPKECQDSALPAWLLAFHVTQENLLMAIFRKRKEGHMMEDWGFCYTNSSDISQATSDHG